MGIDDTGRHIVGSVYHLWDCNNENKNQWFKLAAPKKEVMNQTPKGWFNIVGTTGLCVSAKNNKERLVQQTCGDSDDLLWSTERQGDGIVIKNKTGRVIDNADQNTFNSNQILGNTRNNSPAQIWAVESVGHGDHVHFRNLQRKKCIDDTGRHTVGSVYHLWDCNNENKNQWFKPAAPKKEVMNQTPKGWFNIVGTTGLCVSAKNNKERLVQQTCGDSDDLLWSTKPQGDGIVVINKTGRVIDNAEQNAYNGNQILGNTRNNSPAQIWAVESVGHGDHVHFRNLQRNKCIDDTGRHAVGSVYRLWYCNNDNKNQWFKLAAPVHTDVLPTPADVVLPTPADVVLP